MNRILKAVLLCFCCLSTAVVSEAAPWRGIEPLHSTRAEVERILGPPSGECRCSFYLKDVTVFVVYAGGDCRSRESGGWRVPADTIIRLSVYPKLRPRLLDLKMDQKEFSITEDPELPGILHYNNEAEGIFMEVGQGLVMGFYYEPAAKDKHLRCSGSAVMP